MRKSTVLVASALIACSGAVIVPLSAAAAPHPREWGEKTVSCEVDDFVGEAHVTWDLSGNDLVTLIDSYRITRLNGQSGGDKANINHRITGKTHTGDSFEGGWATSGDSMKQDGLWHSLSQINTRKVSDSPTLFAQVEFTFDRTGADPKCRKNALIRG